MKPCAEATDSERCKVFNIKKSGLEYINTRSGSYQAWIIHKLSIEMSNYLLNTGVLNKIILPQHAMGNPPQQWQGWS